jgi:tetratricopeptide (TPR) repeat protein
MLGKGLIDLGRSEDGLRRIEAAHHLEPTNLDIATDLAIGYAIVGKLDAARDLFRQLLAGHPERTDLHRHLARVYQQQHAYSQAIAHLRAYLQVNRNSIEAIHALAWILATAPATGDRNLDEAASWAERLAQLNAAQSADFHDLVAAIHAADGEFEQAVKHAEQAVDLARDRRGQSVTAVERRLELYRQHRAYTELHE